MKPQYRTAASMLLVATLISGCSDIGGLANTEQSDSTVAASYADARADDASLLSAFYGLDDAVPFFASYRICGGFGHSDGMPVIFSKELDLATMQAGDFLVTLADGREISVACATPAPAEDAGELRTMLLIGDFGSVSNQPVLVQVTGNVISLDHSSNFQGASVAVTPLESGPTLILAETVKEDQWELGKEATSLPFGGGDGCPASTRQVIRVVWTGGVTKPGGDEIDDVERKAYRVFVAGEDGELTKVTPFAIGDLGDGDNNHELCLDVDAPAVRVEFPGNLMTDPREDLNPATSVAVSS
jgi:hypothetical protein